MSKHFEANLTVLMSQEQGKYYAHCLAFDLLAEGTTEPQAKKRLEEMIFEYVRFFLRTNQEQFIFKPAPMKYWAIVKLIRGAQQFVPNLPNGLLQATSPNRIAKFLDTVNAPAI